MKIQNITSFKSFIKPSINRPNIKQTNNKVSFGHCNNEEDSKIVFVGYDCNFIPYSFKDDSFDAAQDTFHLTDIPKSSFRDEELFDSERDFIDSSYYSYDDNDVTSSIEYPLTADTDYLLYRNPDTELNKGFDTDIDFMPTSNMLPIIVPNKKTVVSKLEKPKTPYQRLDELSYLNKFSNKVYSFELNDYLLDKYSNKNHSIDTIKKVLDCSKETSTEEYKNKCLKTDEINYDRMDGIFALLEKGVVQNFDEIYPVLKLADKTLGYREDNFFEVVSLLASEYPLDEVVSAISEKYKKVNYIYVDADDKDDIVAELLTQLRGNIDE